MQARALNRRHIAHVALILAWESEPDGAQKLLAKARLDGFREGVNACCKVTIERQEHEARTLLQPWLTRLRR